MNTLEKLGLEVLAFRLLGSRTKAAMLCAFLQNEEKVLSAEFLSSIRPWANQEIANPKSVVKTRICYLRESLQDVGIRNPIRTVPGGYVMPSHLKPPIMERLLEGLDD